MWFITAGLHWYNSSVLFNCELFSGDESSVTTSIIVESEKLVASSDESIFQKFIRTLNKAWFLFAINFWPFPVRLRYLHKSIWKEEKKYLNDINVENRWDRDAKNVGGFSCHIYIKLGKKIQKTFSGIYGISRLNLSNWWTDPIENNFIRFKFSDII